MKAPPHTLSVTAAAKAIAKGKLTAVELVTSCLERIAAREPSVGAFAYYDPDPALDIAFQADQAEPTGLLHGIPVGIKDVIDTAALPTEYGSPIYRGHRPAWDAACVAQLREAGAVILGKTVTTEFATRFAGKTRNPHDLDHTPGGSSSGSAAAVADLMCPLALGTQTTGSLIRPAAYCGVVGYKPSFNMIDRAGLKPLAQSFDTIGIHARSLRDAALVVETLADYSVPSDVWTGSRPPRLAFCRTPEWHRAAPSTQAAVENASAGLGRAGATVKEVTLPSGFEGLARAHTRISEFEMCRALAYERINFPQQISEHLMDRLRSGLGWTRKDYENAWTLVRRCAAQVNELFQAYDAIIAPAAPGEAPRFEDGTGDPIFSQFWTPLGLPAVTLPVLQGPKGLPVGLQLLGPLGEDARLLAAAEWTHRALM